MLKIKSFWSDITCGESCWSAREEVCRCSCGGANHGITKRGGSAVRTAKIDGYKYKLLAVGKRKDVYGQGEAILNEIGFKAVNHYTGTSYENGKEVQKRHTYHYKWSLTDKGSPARIKYATKAQLEKWKELEPFKNASRFDDISLVWILETMPTEKVTCDCGACPVHWFMTSEEQEKYFSGKEAAA